MKKKILTLFFIFALCSIAVKFIPQVTDWDLRTICALQENLENYSLSLPQLAGFELYILFIILPLAAGIFYFYKNYLLIDMILYASSPVVAYILSHIVKALVQRPRPPLELQLGSHSQSFSFVSTHTFITSVLWGITIYYLIKYCRNKFLKISGITFGVIWMIFEGFSRIWLGVHHLTDVLGGYLFALIVVILYVRLIKLIGGR